MKKIIILSFIAAVFASCDKPQENTENYGVFSFKSEETVVDVDATTDSVELEAIYLSMPSRNLYGKWPLVEFDSEASTAVAGQHFVYTPIREFVGSGDENLSHRIMIIPENITSEVCIVFKTVPSVIKGLVYDPDTDSYSYCVPMKVTVTEDGEIEMYEYQYYPYYPEFIGTTTIRLRPRE